MNFIEAIYMIAWSVGTIVGIAISLFLLGFMLIITYSFIKDWLLKKIGKTKNEKKEKEKCK